MASDAQSEFDKSVRTANRILDAKDGLIRSAGREDFYHAAWTSYVAGWDSYVKRVCREYIEKSNNALALGVSNQAVISSQATNAQLISMYEKTIRSFNTPNFDNYSHLISISTGVAASGDWSWPSKNLSIIDVKSRLDEAVKVRHSFAHGFAVRPIPNLAALDGHNRISYRKTIFVRALLRHLVRTTDRSLNTSLKTNFFRSF